MKEKKALVTGGARGIGAAISKHLLDNGWQVLIHYHSSTEQAENFKTEPAVEVCQADLSRQYGLKKLAESIKDKYNSLDLLVNNAARFKKTPFSDTDYTDWNEQMAVNARAPFFLTQKLSPLLSKAEGSVVNIIDWATKSPYPAYLPYMASKGALETLTLGLARSLAPEVRVNGIAPGPIEFPEDFPGDQKENIIEKTPLKRQGTGKEIA
ncbi:MAG: SDR family NAD(P)-dependent oxidoreductase, partial [bacterium]